MNWERIESARTRARFLLALPWLVIAFLVFAWVAAPVHAAFHSSNRTDSRGRAGDTVLRPPSGGRGFRGVIGYVWMWRIYRAPTRFEGAHWRFHDH